MASFRLPQFSFDSANSALPFRSFVQCAGVCSQSGQHQRIICLDHFVMAEQLPITCSCKRRVCALAAQPRFPFGRSVIARSQLAPQIFDLFLLPDNLIDYDRIKPRRANTVLLISLAIRALRRHCFASQSAPFIPQGLNHFLVRSSRAQLPCAFDPASAHGSRLFTSAFVQRRFHSDPGSGIECRHSLQSFTFISSPLDLFSSP